MSKVTRQRSKETIKQEPSVEQGNVEKTFIATDGIGRMIGSVSAPTPGKATAKIFHQKFEGERELTKDNPVEIHIRDPGAGTSHIFLVWIEISESVYSSNLTDYTNWYSIYYKKHIAST